MSLYKVVALAIGIEITFAPCLAFAAPVDTTADAVLGQLVFTTNQPNQGGASGTAATLNGNRGVAIDRTTGRLFAADSSNNRVLRYSNASDFTNGQAADLVLGQANFISIQSNRGNASPSANSLSDPRGVAVDSAGRLYVADSGNRRLLRFDPPFALGMNAVQVFGQNGSFTTANQSPLNGATANNIGNADGIAVDTAGNLYLADRFLSRVLRYNAPASGGDTTADLVIGQPDFTHADANQNNANPTANTLNHPSGCGLDASGNLYVCDEFNNRVLLFLAPLSNNMSATRVYGQPGFTTDDSNHGGISATSLFAANSCAVDPVSGNLFIADSVNSRILEYTSPQTDSTADRVYGQGGSFTTGVPNNGGISANSINDVAGVTCDAAGNLYAGDQFNNRVLRFNIAPPDSDGDGVPDSIDVCPNNAPGLAVDCAGRPLLDCNHDCLVNAGDIQCIANVMLTQ